MDMKLKYDEIFRKAFDLGDAVSLEGLDIFSVENWSSVEHIEFITMLEETFGITLSSEDIFQLTSYDNGIRLLKRLRVIE